MNTKDQRLIDMACTLLSMACKAQQIADTVKMIYDLGHAQGKLDGLTEVQALRSAA